MRQRVAGAIAISCQPSLLLADEPTTSLDVTIQAQYLRLLKDLQRQTNVAFIFVTHDLGIVAKMCDRVAGCMPGRLSKVARPGTFLRSRGIHIRWPSSAVCHADAGPRAPGDDRGPASDLTICPGCSFAPRCPLAQEPCHTTSPPLEELLNGHNVACWRAEQTAESARSCSGHPARRRTTQAPGARPRRHATAW